VGGSLLMSRHTSFKFCLDPTVEQHEVLARHAGAARFAFNQCLPADGTALTSTPRVPVKPARMKREQTFTPHQRPEPTTPEKGGAEHSTLLFNTL
jgi:Helix-turn-helix domain